MIFYQILSQLILEGNVQRSVCIICMWILGLKGLRRSLNRDEAQQEKINWTLPSFTDKVFKPFGTLQQPTLLRHR